jgi:hypothetical protein
MNVSGEQEERPTSWRAVAPNTPVFATDGLDVGTVDDVQGWDQEDIFHGLLVRDASDGTVRFVPASQVRAMTTSRIEIDLSAEDVRALPPYVEQDRSAEDAFSARVNSDESI